mmetsp:Transcript_5287/g.10002  ORF Transcript_5287/g.10002 Transcript_5287/m.10002 type:complete len:223 (-) Transcript_5287:167-835(-)
MDTPSRSTVFHPDAAESRTTSTKPSSSRFTSSTYKMPRFALASSPGSYAFTPSESARSMSIVPQMRSSVAPRGSSITGILMALRSRGSPRLDISLASGPISAGLSGLELYWSPTTTSISGRISAIARTACDLPVPRSPIISTPPSAGSMMLSMRPSFMSSCPTILTNGNTGLLPRAASTAREALLRTASDRRRDPPILPARSTRGRRALAMTCFAAGTEDVE